MFMCMSIAYVVHAYFAHNHVWPVVYVVHVYVCTYLCVACSMCVSCVYVYTFVHSLWCVCVCMRRPELDVIFCLLPPPLSDCPETESLTNLEAGHLGWIAAHQLSPGAEFTEVCSLSGSLYGWWDSNSDPHVCVATLFQMFSQPTSSCTLYPAPPSLCCLSDLGSLWWLFPVFLFGSLKKYFTTTTTSSSPSSSSSYLLKLALNTPVFSYLEIADVLVVPCGCTLPNPWWVESSISWECISSS